MYAFLKLSCLFHFLFGPSLPVLLPVLADPDAEIHETANYKDDSAEKDDDDCDKAAFEFNLFSPLDGSAGEVVSGMGSTLKVEIVCHDYW